MRRFYQKQKYFCKNMKIHCIYGRNYDSNIYVVTGEKPTIIDTGTGLFNELVIKDIEKIVNLENIEQIILTHEHFDHVGGIKKILEKTDGNTKIISHVDAAGKIESGDSDFAKMLGGVMPKIPVDTKLKEGDKLVIGDETFEILHTPGHTPGCICLYSKESKTLFSGDTVFANGSFGRYDFPGGNPRDLRKSIERLVKLDVVNLYPGHETIVEGEGKKHLELTFKNTRYLI